MLRLRVMGHLLRVVEPLGCLRTVQNRSNLTDSSNADSNISQNDGLHCTNIYIYISKTPLTAWDCNLEFTTNVIIPYSKTTHPPIASNNYIYICFLRGDPKVDPFDTSIRARTCVCLIVLFAVSNTILTYALTYVNICVTHFLYVFVLHVLTCCC